MIVGLIDIGTGWKLTTSKIRLKDKKRGERDLSYSLADQKLLKDT